MNRGFPKIGTAHLRIAQIGSGEVCRPSHRRAPSPVGALLAAAVPGEPAVPLKSVEQGPAASAGSLHPREFGLHHQVKPVTDQTGADGGQHINSVWLLAQGLQSAI